MHGEGKGIAIWFFIGWTLLIYGLLIFLSGVYQWVNPPLPDQRVVLWELHSDVWWGAFLAIVGLIYVLVYKPSEEQLRQLKQVFR